MFLMNMQKNFWGVNNMAQRPRCSVCDKFDSDVFVCSAYPQKIPEDIFSEKSDCEFYSLKNIDYSSTYDDLPIAKGR